MRTITKMMDDDLSRRPWQLGVVIVAILAVIVAMYEWMPAGAAVPGRVSVASVPASHTEWIPQVVIQIPVGTTVTVRRTSPDSSVDARLGDAVTAVTTEEIRYKGELVIPVGTPLSGHVIDLRPVLRVVFDRIGSYAADLDLASTWENESALLRFTEDLIVR